MIETQKIVARKTAPTENIQRRILEFVKKQLNSKSPKTRKIAKEFLAKWGDE
jgi:hypothetical protein